MVYPKFCKEPLAVVLRSLGRGLINYIWVGGGMEEVKQRLGPCGQIQVTYIEDKCI